MRSPGRSDFAAEDHFSTACYRLVPGSGVIKAGKSESVPLKAEHIESEVLVEKPSLEITL
jgi:hypothetical protein